MSIFIRGFSFNGKHSSEMKIMLHSKTIQSPSKKKIKESVPFMNGSYDFSTVSTNGEIVYEEREITVELGLPADTKEGLQFKYTMMLKWLVDVGRSRLIFDDMPDYYYTAEVESTTTLEQLMEFGKVSVTFIAYPFKNSVEYAGEETWNLFNFEFDITQTNTFTVNGPLDVVINNCGRPVWPIMIVSNLVGNLSATLNGYTMILKSGENQDLLFKFQNGDNKIHLTGNGVVKFLFRKEII